MDGKATLVIKRRNDPWADRMRRYSIFLDGAPIGKIGRGEELRFSPNAGEHTLRMGIDWCSSKTLALSIAGGEILYMTVGFNRYVTLDPV